MLPPVTSAKQLTKMLRNVHQNASGTLIEQQIEEGRTPNEDIIRGYEMAVRFAEELAGLEWDPDRLEYRDE